MVKDQPKGKAAVKECSVQAKLYNLHHPLTLCTFCNRGVIGQRNVSVCLCNQLIIDSGSGLCIVAEVQHYTPHHNWLYPVSNIKIISLDINTGQSCKHQAYRSFTTLLPTPNGVPNEHSCSDRIF